jgi:hypothetical protein
MDELAERARVQLPDGEGYVVEGDILVDYETYRSQVRDDRESRRKGDDPNVCRNKKWRRANLFCNDGSCRSDSNSRAQEPDVEPYIFRTR